MPLNKETETETEIMLGFDPMLLCAKLQKNLKNGT